MQKLLFLLFKIKTALCGCGNEIILGDFSQGKKEFKIEFVNSLPKDIDESSGLLYSEGIFTSMNDSGGESALFSFDEKGNLKNKIQFDKVKNVDWESLTKDDEGNIYIGDIGNNRNMRKDLKIYKLDKNTNKITDVIHFNYEDQKDFPSSRKNKNFDCEAMFFCKDSLYLCSKNRGHKRVALYVIPAIQGTHVAKKIDEFRINAQVTDAAINPSKTTFALLTYAKVLLFEVKNRKIDFSSPKFCLKTRRNQTEAISFKNETDFYFTNEQGKMYFVKKK